jgi:hypothetical protein
LLTLGTYLFSLVGFCLILSFPSAYTAAVLHFKNLGIWNL